MGEIDDLEAGERARAAGGGLRSIALHRRVLFAAPLRRALVEESIEPFAKILARVAHQDEVLALVPRQPPLQARHRLLGRAQRQRRMAGEQPRDLIGALVERCEILDDLAEQPDAARPPRRRPDAR